jgi:hypothetical protein
MISIIIPVFNAEKYLPKTIELILDQSYCNFELLLIDDGSTDNSYGICNRYAETDKRVRVIHQNNMGASSARNKGIEEAQYDLLTFIDSDDEIDRNYLQELYNDYISQKKADLVIQGMVQKWTNQTREFLLTRSTFDLTSEQQTQFFKSVYLNNFSGPYCKLFKKSILIQYDIRFSNNIIYAEDFDFLLQYIFYCKIITTSPAANYYYIMHDNSVSCKIYSFQQEHMGIRQLYSSFVQITKKYDSIYLKKMMTDSITAYFWRVIYSNYWNNYTRTQRIMNLKSISIILIQYFIKYYKPSTIFTRLIYNLIKNKKYQLLDLLLNLRLSQNN